MTRFDKLIDITPTHEPPRSGKLPDWPPFSFIIPFFAGSISADIHIANWWFDASAQIALIAAAGLWQARILRRWQRRSIKA
ncbi:MAG: hypothetical protein ABGX47_23905 [Martelella sp.]|uniref:hypothetical protein n=1 Tax=Martelella sp. TaxID=1969699 RepID=UPI003242BF3C